MPNETEMPPMSEGAEEERSFDFVEFISTLWSGRKIIAGVTGAVTVLSIIISLLMPKYYKSTVVLLPETDKSKLGGLAGLSGLASLAGVNVGEIPLEMLYPTIITSEAVLREVIYHKYETKEFNQPVNLIEYWEIEHESLLSEYEIALVRLRGALEVSLDRKTNVLQVSLLMKEPQLAADILNKLASELDRFIRTKRTTNASEQRKWIEVRLDEVKIDLEKSEDVLKDFREKNRRVIDSPQLLLEQERLIREVQINSTLYTELKKQYELIKIEEIKNIPIVNVMDDARPAAKKDKPRRKSIVLLSLFLSALASSVFVYGMNHYNEQVRRIFSVFSSRSTTEQVS